MSDEVRRAAGRAVIYLRVSYQGQVDNDYDPEGNSIPAQRKACRRKAEELGVDVVEEYVDPGRSALEVKNRPEFQKMMARIRSRRDVDYVIVYARSRMHRNATDALLTRRELKQLGVALISIRDFTDDSDMGDMIGTILDAVNEYQSRASGADVAFKMEAKAKNGGTPGAAPLGYLNVVEEIDGRKVNTVAVDSERAPYVRAMFELYSTGKYSFAQLRDEMTEAGLRTRSTKRFPGGRAVSIHKIGKLLRDRYYLGYVIHKGKESPGRHEALIDQGLFDQVQEVIEAKQSSGIRQRVHDHPLKGPLECGRCGGRLYLDRGNNSRGTVYFYFSCLGWLVRSCDLPRLKAELVQAAVEDHHATLRLPQPTVDTTNKALSSDTRERRQIGQGLRRKLKVERARFIEQQGQYLDLVGNPDWPQEVLAEKMREVRDRIARIDKRLETIDDDPVEQAGQAVRALLELLEGPRSYFRSLTDQGQQLTLACFAKLVVEADQDTQAPWIERDEVKAPFSPLVGRYEKRQRMVYPLASAAALPAVCSSNELLARPEGFEPPTF
ncbi:recombinase family protein [Glycomyces sp. NRRL B-16210]|uniref:recombinase family protein n=1 Tax=Glycomyces sp. NRRL B-16210 TaxID=1463821 RepID=UPI0010D45A35